MARHCSLGEEMQYIVQCWSDKHCIGPFEDVKDCLDYLNDKFVKDLSFVLAHDDEYNHTLMHITNEGVAAIENFTIHPLIPPEVGQHAFT
jgi:hypothetical protein